MMEKTRTRRWLAGRVAVVMGLYGTAGSAALAQAPSLARFYGFDPPRIVVVDDGAGPSLSADMDGDGLKDLIVVNNRKSRIEIHRQRKQERTRAEIEREYKVNELPPSAWYDRVEISVGHQVMGFRVIDADGDGDMDILYAGRPDEIVLMEQTAPMTFDEGAKRRVAGLALGQDGFEIADVMDDEAPEVIALVGGKIHVYEFRAGLVRGEPTVLGSGGDLLAFFVEDYNGDGAMDIMGAIPDDASPVRMWLQSAGRMGASAGQKRGVLGPESLFEMPALIEVEPVRLAGRAAASIAVIERATRRIVLHDVVTEGVAGGSETGAERDAAVEVFGFRGGSDKDRAVVVADVDADGLPDVLATDRSANSVVLYRQASGVGLGEGKPFSAFKSPTSIAAGQWDGDPELELFVLSEDEKTVGVADYDSDRGRFEFPQPIPTETQGASPVAMAYLTLRDGPAVGMVVRDKRDHTLEIHRPNGAAVMKVELTDVNRPPKSAIAGDFDHDGHTDVILFTPNEPMVMVRSVGGTQEEIEVLNDDRMRQFGLVQAAGPENTAPLDVDGDGFAELLIADANFVRACTFDKEKGWRVVEQITMPEASARLVGLSVLERAGGGAPAIVAADAGNDRIVIMSRAGDGSWETTDKLRLTGIKPGALRAGSFTGDGQPTIMALGEGGFALVRLGGQRVALEEVAAFRSDREDRAEHEIEVGDVNNDGFTDLVVLDSRERMCQIYALSASRKIVFATEFEVFESRLFSRGDARERQPSAAVVDDVTGDGAADLVLQVHDRFLIFPQMTR